MAGLEPAIALRRDATASARRPADGRVEPGHDDGAALPPFAGVGHRTEGAIPTRRGERGFALIAVVWVIALLCVMAMDVLAAARREAGSAADLRLRAQLAAAADAGITLGAHALARGAPAGRSLEFAGVRLDIAAEDEAGKIDLNLAPASLLRALFEALGLPPAAAEGAAAAVQDWRDADEAARPRGGAETAEYRAARAAVPPRDSPFQSVAELAHVLGVGPELAARAAPALTVHSKREAPERGRAGALVAAALGGGSGGPAEPAGAAPFAGASGRDPLAGRVYLVRAEASAGEARLARTAIVRLTGDPRDPVWVQQYR